MASAEDEPAGTLDDAVAASLAQVAAAAAAVSDSAAPAKTVLEGSSSPCPPQAPSRPVGPDPGQAPCQTAPCQTTPRQTARSSPLDVAASNSTLQDTTRLASSSCISNTPANSGPPLSPSPSPSPSSPPTPQKPTASSARASISNLPAVVEPRVPSGAKQNGGDSASASQAGGNMSSHSPALSTALHGLPDAYSVPSVVPPSPYAPSAGIPPGQYSTYSSTADAYRVSPSTTSAPMSLPSMRTMEAAPKPVVSQAQPPIHAGSLSMGIASSLPSPVATSTPFYVHHSMVLPSGYGHDSANHYSMPHDARILSARGPKKEIKRRTKTGCLTCRKRRIKCDETHPTCNNCRKSKRDCLGYDPIFRPQCGSGTANPHIQPALASANQPHRPDTLHTACVSVPSSYTGQIAPAPSSVATPRGYSPSAPALAHAASSSTKTPSASFQHLAPTQSEASYEARPSKTDLPNEQEATSGTVRQLQVGPVFSESKHLAGQNQSTSSQTNRIPYSAAHGMKICEIIDSLGPPPPRQQYSCSDETFNEITKVYHEMYAGGLGAFFESTWYYFANNGKMHFPRDSNLIEHMACFLKTLEAVKANDHTQMAYSGVLETRIVWELACTAYQSPELTNKTMRMLPPEGDPTEVRNRLRVVEALLCGDCLADNPLAPPVADADQHRIRQFDFWYSLAEFVRKRDNPCSPPALKARGDMLARMRHLLDGRENRDVLYSIAVVRELAPNYESGYGSSVPQHLDESDPKNRLAVASRFIIDEAQVTGGTTNVVRRFSDIAARAFVNPGVNITRQRR